jgi:DNA-binding winged helix-turn-helix (wHTH) protein
VATTARIELAQEPDFRLGVLQVRPGLRQVRDDAGAEEVVEPRIMQVLVALARAEGAILTRDALTDRCWDGRVVGEDAINRVMSRLRRLAHGIGRDSFAVETITRVGYRLVVAAGDAAPRPALAPEVAAPARPDRRALLAGGGAAAAVLAAAGAGWFWPRGTADRDAPPAAVRELMAQARFSTGQATPEGNAQAIGLLRQVVEIAPDYPLGWGSLAASYGRAARSGPPEGRAAMRQRALAALARAEALDPTEPTAVLTRIALTPSVGRYAANEALLRRALQARPDAVDLIGTLAAIYVEVGRNREAAALGDRLYQREPPAPAMFFRNARTLWAAGRLEDADAVIARGTALFPSHYAIWFTRFYLLLYTSRAGEALSMADDVAARPTGIPSSEFDAIRLVAAAVVTRDAATAERAMQVNLALAHAGAGHAENTIAFAALLGRVDTAFAVAEGYFFGRGFQVADVRFTPEQGNWTTRDNRHSYMLFEPVAAPLWRDPRFAALTRELGLDAYWRAAKVVPDFRRG